MTIELTREEKIKAIADRIKATVEVKDTGNGYSGKWEVADSKKVAELIFDLLRAKDAK